MMEYSVLEKNFESTQENKSATPLKSFVGDASIDIEPEMNRKASGTRKMYFAALSALLLAVAMGLCTGYSAPATHDMQHRRSSIIRPTLNEVTWIGSILALGAMVGGIFSGPLADKMGRKDMLIFNIIPFSIGWIIICYAKTVPVIIVGRFFCGIACGVVSVTVPMYCVEISTSEVRGILGSSFQGFLVIGNLLCVIIGLYVSWDYLALVGAIFATFGVICFCPMPESPRWFLAKNKLQNAIYAMNQLQGGYVDAERECTEIYRDLENQPKGKLSLVECKHPTVYKPALISVVLMFFQQFSGSNAVLFYSSDIFDITEDFLDPKKATVILAAVQVIATLLSNLIVDKAGRKLLLIFSGIFMALSLAVLGIFYYMSSSNTDFQHKYSWMPLASLNLFIIAFSIGFGPVPWLLTAEMVPVRARSTASGLATFANGLFAFIVTKTFGELEVIINRYGTFWFYSFISVLGVVFVIFMVPETKGKQLEEIEKVFYNSKQPERSISISVIS